MNQGILAVSFGTTHLDTLHSSIAATEDDIRRAFPGVPVYRAFTSPTVRRRLLSREGLAVDSVETAMERMRRDGIRTVTVQPTLLIPGEEFDRLRETVSACAGDLQVQLGLPLLSGREDVQWLMAVLRKNFPAEPGTLLLFMGHGTEHPANDFYRILAERMAQEPCMRLCTVEGKPDFDDGVRQARALGLSRVQIVPLMLVAGDHACKDMAGPEADSLQSRLTAAGMEVRCRMQGLGQLEDIRQRYVQRIRQARPL